MPGEKKNMAGNKEPRWQPISALPLLTMANDGMREAAEAQHQNLQEARQHPYVLDDATAGGALQAIIVTLGIASK